HERAAPKCADRHARGRGTHLAPAQGSPVRLRALDMKPTGWAVGTGLLAVAAATLYGVAGAWPFVDENDNPTLAPLLERVTPAVVNVAVASAAPQVPQDPLLEDPFLPRFFALPR